MLEIQKDIDILTEYAAIGFDGLPEHLQPVLTSVGAGTMPMKWRPQELSGLLPIPIEQGFKSKDRLEEI